MMSFDDVEMHSTVQLFSLVEFSFDSDSDGFDGAFHRIISNSNSVLFLSNPLHLAV